MKKILLAALAAGVLAVGACSAPGAETTPTTESSTFVAPPRHLESTTAAPARPASGLSSKQRTEAVYYATLAEEGIVVDDAAAYLAGQATCEFIDEGGSMPDLMLGLAMSEEDPFGLGISNEDLPFLMGAAIGAFCPENAGAIR